MNSKVARRSISSQSPADSGPSAPSGVGRLRAVYMRRRALIRGVVTLILVGLAWEAVTQTLMEDSLGIAPISAIADRYVELIGTGELWVDIRTSGLEFLLGFGLAAVVGLTIGFAMGVSPFVRDSIDPIVSGMYATPVIALAPLFILWFGIGIASKIAVVFMLAVLPIIINTDTGVRTVETNFVETARSFTATRRQIYRKVVFPAALPTLITGIRLGVGRGLLGVVAGELFAAKEGLGLLIVASAQTFDPAGVFVGIFTVAFAGIAVMLSLRVLERKLTPWRDESGPF